MLDSRTITVLRIDEGDQGMQSSLILKRGILGNDASERGVLRAIIVKLTLDTNCHIDSDITLIHFVAIIVSRTKSKGSILETRDKTFCCPSTSNSIDVQVIMQKNTTHVVSPFLCEGSVNYRTKHYTINIINCQ
ncbi:hypothetical protein HOB10_04305 [Candidatus Parcubacteria bacterium]|nr:hypothetical protein [Candidatus Parcubacteria bacterium]